MTILYQISLINILKMLNFRFIQQRDHKLPNNQQNYEALNQIKNIAKKDFFTILQDIDKNFKIETRNLFQDFIGLNNIDYKDSLIMMAGKIIDSHIKPSLDIFIYLLDETKDEIPNEQSNSNKYNIELLKYKIKSYEIQQQNIKKYIDMLENMLNPTELHISDLKILNQQYENIQIKLLSLRESLKKYELQESEQNLRLDNNLNEDEEESFKELTNITRLIGNLTNKDEKSKTLSLINTLKEICHEHKDQNKIVSIITRLESEIQTFINGDKNNQTNKELSEVLENKMSPLRFNLWKHTFGLFTEKITHMKNSVHSFIKFYLNKNFGIDYTDHEYDNICKNFIAQFYNEYDLALILKAHFNDKQEEGSLFEQYERTFIDSLQNTAISKISINLTTLYNCYSTYYKFFGNLIYETKQYDSNNKLSEFPELDTFNKYQQPVSEMDKKPGNLKLLYRNTFELMLSGSVAKLKYSVKLQ